MTGRMVHYSASRTQYVPASLPKPADVLVVDDEVEIATFVAEVLRDEGYGVRVAHDGASALVEILRRPPSLILLDVAMPVMVGEELIRHLRRVGLGHLPVIIMTAALNPETYRAYGVREVLPKPFDIETLLAAVRRHLLAPDQAPG